MVSSKNLAKALYKLSSEENKSSDVVSNAFLKYIDEYNLKALLPQIVNYLEEFNRMNKEFNTLNISTGYTMEDKIIEDIKSMIKVSDKDIVNIKEESELIGGFTATYQGIIYDASIRNQLQLLKQKLIKT